MTTTPAESTIDLVPTPQELGANKVTFTGDRTTITFFPQTPGPVILGHEGGELTYEGPEDSLTLFGSDIARLESPLGYILTVVLRPAGDLGELAISILLPRVTGVARQAPVVFTTLAIKTAGRGFIDTPGALLGYDVLPLTATAEDVILAD